MDTGFINLDSGNIASEHLCCIIRTQKAHPGVEAKRAWLAARLDEGHVFRKVNAKGCAFIGICAAGNGLGARGGG